MLSCRAFMHVCVGPGTCGHVESQVKLRRCIRAFAQPTRHGSEHVWRAPARRATPQQQAQDGLKMQHILFVCKQSCFSSFWFPAASGGLSIIVTCINAINSCSNHVNRLAGELFPPILPCPAPPRPTPSCPRSQATKEQWPHLFFGVPPFDHTTCNPAFDYKKEAACPVAGNGSSVDIYQNISNWAHDILSR